MPLRGRTNLTEESFFFVTTTVVDFVNVFKNTKCCDLLISNIKHYQKKYNFEILAYVIMPNHFHWIVQVDPTRGTISDIMRDIKKYSAWDIMEIIENIKEKNLIEIFEKNAMEYKDRKRKFWKKRFDDQVIRDQKMFCTKLRYIHNNPVKAGLVTRPEEYRYSSARNYINGDHSIIWVNTKMLGVIIE
jgi:putative transposase